MADAFAKIQVRFDKNSESGHYLYLKEHRVRKKETEDGERKNTILILNVPPYIDKKCLRRIFGQFGQINYVHVQKRPGNLEEVISGTKFFPMPTVKGFHVAYITYQNHKGVEAALQRGKVEEPIFLSTENEKVLIGIQKWCLDYVQSIPDVTKLQSEIDKFMEEYDQKAEEEEKAEMENDGIPDEDGWIKVTRKGKNPGFSRTESTQLKLKQKEKRKRKEKELLNVYTYQIRESKREKIAELRRKFEEDKEKIKVMRESRKFKPF